MRGSILVVAGLAGCVHRPPGDASPAGWDALQRGLPGEYVASLPDGREIRARWTLIANGSVLHQSFVTPSGRETVTVIHPDGATMMATHYCGQGNQPRLIASDREHPTAFVLRDVTGLDPDEAMLVRLELTVTEAGFDEADTYRDPSDAEHTDVLRFRRVGGGR